MKFGFILTMALISGSAFAQTPPPRHNNTENTPNVQYLKKLLFGNANIIQGSKVFTGKNSLGTCTVNLSVSRFGISLYIADAAVDANHNPTSDANYRVSISAKTSSYFKIASKGNQITSSQTSLYEDERSNDQTLETLSFNYSPGDASGVKINSMKITNQLGDWNNDGTKYIFDSQKVISKTCTINH